jgi:diguanylate cyclase (GGDEF)-like protein/PAS domain S-box-containing protein
MLSDTTDPRTGADAISDARRRSAEIAPSAHSSSADPPGPSATGAMSDFQEFGAGTVDALTAGIAILDQYGTIIAVNRVWREFARQNGLRLPRAGVGANYLTVCDSTMGTDAATAQAAAARIRAVLDGSAAEPTLEYAMESDQGPRWYAMRATRFAGAGPGRVVVGHEEITKRRHANDELRRERDFIAAVLDTTSSLVVVLDRAGRIVRFNRACEQLSGYTFAEAAHCYLWDLLLLPEEVGAVRQVFAEVHEQGFPIPHENHWITRDGRRRLIAWSNTALLDPTGAVEYLVCTGIDITEKKQAEAARHRSEARFAKIFHSNPATMLISRLADGVVLDANRSCLLAWGYARAELIGARAGALDLWVDPGALPLLIQRLRDAGFVRNQEVRLRKKTGEIRHAAISMELIDIDGEPCVMTIADDITERRQAEDALKESEARYRDLLEHANDLIQSVDAAGAFLYVNPAWRHALGYSEDEIAHLHIHDVVHPDYLAPAAELWQRLLAGETVDKLETVLVARDGRHIVVEGSISCKFEGDRPISTRSILRDITARKRAEEELRRSEQQLGKIFDVAPVGMALVAPDGTLLKVNSALCTMLGYSEAELHARTVHAISYLADTTSEIRLAERAARGEIPSYTVEKRYVTRWGDALWGELTSTPIRDTGGQVVYSLAIIQDITERKRTEEALHELTIRDPLTGLYNRRGMTRLLKEELDRHRRYGSPLALVIFDVDHFKQVNDTYGHHVGDAVLRWLGHLLRGGIRTLDRAVRYGGEEFAVILPNASAREALALAERLRQTVAAEPCVIPLDNQPPLTIAMRISLGVASTETVRGTESDLIQAADAALYAAKHQGRNRAIPFRPRLAAPPDGA